MEGCVNFIEVTDRTRLNIASTTAVQGQLPGRHPEQLNNKDKSSERFQESAPVVAPPMFFVYAPSEPSESALT